jgi:hypothetical protein
MFFVKLEDIVTDGLFGGHLLIFLIRHLIWFDFFFQPNVGTQFSIGSSPSSCDHKPSLLSPHTFTPQPLHLLCPVLLSLCPSLFPKEVRFFSSCLVRKSKALPNRLI